MSVYYPIGTVVKLSVDEKALFMIAGYMVRQGDDKIRDYFGVPFPVGLIKENHYVLFDRKCITEVVHKGYCDESCQAVLDGFDQFANNLSKFAMNANQGENN